MKNSKAENQRVINEWNKAAEIYSKTQRVSPNTYTNFEMLKEAIGDVSNKAVLDAGCGDGYFANELLKMGAKVSAIDGSSAQIKLAKKEFKGIGFEVCDLTKLLPYDASEFDAVVSSLVLMDIENIETFLSEANRVLKSDGRFVFSIVHPCFFLGHWDKDENGNKLYKNVGNYWEVREESLEIWGKTTHYHRPITWYSKMLKKHGFLIEEISENTNNKEVFENEQNHHKRIPLYMCFSCVKTK